MFNAWRARRQLSKEASLSKELYPESEAPIGIMPPAAPVSISARIQETSGDLWATDDIDIGITRVVLPRLKDGDRASATILLYEISLRFPHAGRLWRVQRSFADFVALHSAMEIAFTTPLFDRNIHLPRPSRQSWGDFRSNSSTGSCDDPAAQQMLLKLNAYLRKLVEIEAVIEHDQFRDFLTPRPTSSGDTEVRAKMLPSLSITPISSIVSELHMMKSVASPTAQHTATSHCPPPVESQCAHPIHFGSGIQLRALAGLRVGLTKRGGLSGGQKAVAVAAGVAGIAFTGPLSAAIALGALGGGVGKYQMNKSFYLTVNKAKNTGKPGFLKSLAAQDKMNGNGIFVVENAELVSGPRRAFKFGDLIHLFCRNVRKSVRIGHPPDSKRGHLMVTSAESKRATLRLVSPYGYRGNVVCGSQVYIQVLNGQWAGQYMGLHNDFISTGSSPTVFKICQQDHACLASEEIIPIARPLASSSPRAPFKLRVMVYNVWLFPSILTNLNEKICPLTMPRAQAIPKCIAPLDVDVVVFCEAFCGNARELLVKGMKELGFLFETKVVGEGASVSNKKAIDGGCFAMSKYPLEHFEELTFGSVAVSDDRMADKGVIYFQLRTAHHRETVHVFGTHLQAWDTQVAVTTRKQQLRALQEFIKSKKIPSHDAVVIAGDLNVDRCGADSQEYDAMLRQLDVEDPELLPSSSQFSFDPLTNKLAFSGPSSGGRTERLDYVLSSRSHRRPASSSVEIVQLKASKQWTRPQGSPGEELVDLSDHYPVVCELQYE